MVKEIEGIVSPPTVVWDRYIDNLLQTNNLGNIPDGEYRVVDEFHCNFEKTYTPGGIIAGKKEMLLASTFTPIRELLSGQECLT